MKYNRRDFLKFACMAWVMQSCSLAPKRVLRPKNESLYFGYGTDPDAKGVREYGIKVMSPGKIQKTQLQNEIHSIAYSENHDLKAFMPKQGPVSYYQKSDGELMAFYPEAGNHFYGHGVFDEKRGVFYTTQSKINTSQYERHQRYDAGEIYVHSLKDFSIIDKFPTYGTNPHDLLIHHDELIVCNGGENSNVAYIDLNSRKLIKAFVTKDGNHISFGHLEIMDDENVIAATGSRRRDKPCLLYLVNKKTGLKRFAVPSGMEDLLFGQLLSVSCFEGHVYATCPGSDFLFAWKNSGEFVAGYPLPSASSLAISEKHQGILVGSGNHLLPLHVARIDGGELVVRKLDWGETMTGAHSLLI